MPLVAHNDLPTFERLASEGQTILPTGRALSQEIREMHIGFLNMMPDAALEATERQFFRLVGESNKIAQFYIRPFTLPELERGPEARAHIEKYYEPFDKLKEEGLDAVIITGANISDPDLTKASFWEPMQHVMDWAWDNACSTLCSCLATHAVMQFKYGQKRTPQKQKVWGVYEHSVLDKQHALLRSTNTRFDVPHSRHNAISSQQFIDAGMKVLAESSEGDPHIAVSQDGFRLLCFQGHPEYDTLSLYKEYKREVMRFANGERGDYPPFPENYFDADTQKTLKEIEKAVKKGQKDWPLTDDDMFDEIENTWRDTARATVGNWIGLVYQLTHVDRQKQFMDGVDPNNPLKNI